MIRTIVIDCDGVLTAGKQYVDHTGEKVIKDFHCRDIRAIRELAAAGIDVVVMTADDWPGTPAWCERVGCRFICTRDKVATCVEQCFLPEETLVLGDDAWDVRAMRWAKYRACPADADDSAREAALGTWVLKARAGRGVVAELVRELARRGHL